jgi:hypothetical protein
MTMSREHGGFGIEQARMLAEAVTATCTALHIPADDKQARAIIAARVADLARAGVSSVEVLRDRVVREAQTTV